MGDDPTKPHQDEEVSPPPSDTSDENITDFNHDADSSSEKAYADHGSGEDDAAGGSAPDPESDDDVGEMVARVTGQDPDPEMEDPKEVGLGDAIDEDEEALHQS